MNDKNLIAGALVLMVAVGAILYAISGSPTSPTSQNPETSPSAVASGPNLPLAQCLKDKGVFFYGAFWCPHCRAQKALFGDAVSALPYVECSNPDQSQNQLCTSKNIHSYPTWRFPDGSELTGEQTLATLAEKSSCQSALNGASSAPASTTTGAATKVGG